jgi:hypothetical protein
MISRTDRLLFLLAVLTGVLAGLLAIAVLYTYG